MAHEKDPKYHNVGEPDKLLLHMNDNLRNFAKGQIWQGESTELWELEICKESLSFKKNLFDKWPSLACQVLADIIFTQELLATWSDLHKGLLFKELIVELVSGIAAWAGEVSALKT